MRKFLKIALILLVGLPTIAVAAYWFIGKNAERKADTTDIRPSQALQTLVSEYKPRVSDIRQPDCNDWRYQDRGRGSKIAASLSFNSLVDEARSAESAALRYKQRGNNDMAVVAAQDAVTRWERVWELKAEMNCYDIQIRRNSY